MACALWLWAQSVRRAGHVFYVREFSHQRISHPVLYHLDKELVPGGFVGVDVFFVLSGFLITGHILGELRRDLFSFASFYARRVKRIFPPLAVMLLLNVIVSLFAFTRSVDVVHVAKGTIFSILSLSNFFLLFGIDHGYFSSEAELDPLTHMWSLGVEEQFYLVLPLLLYLLHRQGAVAYVVALLIASSFVLAEVLVAWFPMFAYYMLPTRMGELLLGSAIVMFDLPKLIKPYALAASIGGMVMIVVPMFLMDETVPFPGLRAIPPTLGTLLVICSQHPALTAVLSTAPLQLLGLGSYSLYLYHWPLMAYLRLFRVSFAGIHGVVIILFSLNLAYLSYVLVETPTRLLRWSNRNIFLFLFAVPFAVLLCLSLGAAQFGGQTPLPVVASGGEGASGVVTPGGVFPTTASLMQIPLIPYEKEIMTAKTPWTQNLCFYSYFIVPFASLQECHLNGRNSGGGRRKAEVLLWGDSHAFHYVGALEEFAIARDSSFVHSCMAACPPMINVKQLYHVNPLCNGFNDFMFKEMVGYPWIILGGRWSYHQFTQEHIDDLISRIRKQNPTCSIVLLGETPHFKEFSLKTCPEVATADMNCDHKVAVPNLFTQKYPLSFNLNLQVAAATHERVWYWDALSQLCPKGEVRSFASVIVLRSHFF
jgi:peptidoglycan/LPS O-acetylase OafA/YrhL